MGVKQKPETKVSWLWWLAAAALYFAVYGYNLQFPPEMYYDEVYQVKTARHILHLERYDQTTHPPLGMLLISLSMVVFGDVSWAWRLPSLVTGFGVIAAIYLVCEKITLNRRVALFAAALYFLDCMSFTQARIGMLNMPMLFFALLSLLFMIKYAVTREWSQEKAFLFAGAFFGMAMATRWVAVTMAAPLGFLYLKVWFEEKDKLRLIKNTLIYFCVLPLVIYVATFFFMPFMKGHTWRSIIEFHSRNINYNLYLKQGHTYGSEWWSWPIMTRPIWYEFRRVGENVKGILCIGNPAIFWVIPIAMTYALWEFLKKQSLLFVFVIGGFLSQWVPWAFVSRVKFFHYFDPAMPFVCLAIALGLDKFWTLNRRGRWAVIVYGIVVVGFFIYWYPLLNGIAIPEPAFRQRMWFPSWI